MVWKVGTTVPAEVGSRVRYRSNDKEIDGTVLQLNGEHARCAFVDGRSAWVPIASLVTLSAPMALSVRPPLPATTSPTNPDDVPVGNGWLAFIYLFCTIIPCGHTIIGMIAFSLP